MDTLDFLIGDWRLERLIEDHRSGVAGTFSGTGSLRSTDAGEPPARQRAVYEEAGELSFGRYRGPAGRSLEYLRQGNGSVLLCFTDGRPYIEVDLRDGTCSQVHDCGEDRYEIRFDVVSDRVLEERWRVSGPSKSYESLTTLTRISAFL